MSRHDNKYLFYARKFLNKRKHHSTAVLIAEVTEEQYKDRDKNDTYYAHGCLNITDCSSNISLTFDINTESQMKNSLHKITELKKTIDQFEVKLQEAVNKRRTYLKAKQARDLAEKKLASKKS